MDFKERINAFISGEKPDRIPYTIYNTLQRKTVTDSVWGDFFTAGMGAIWHVNPVKETQRNVERKANEYSSGNIHYRRVTLSTPVGEIHKISASDPGSDNPSYWTQKYFLETPEDYRVMTYIVENTDYCSNISEFNKIVNQTEAHDYVYLRMGRTPMQVMLVDYAGVENLGFHLYDYEEEVERLYKALLENFARKVEITCEIPANYVQLLENFSGDTLGPDRYKQFMLPVYEKYIKQLRAAGKFVGAHYDGRLSRCKEVIATAPIDIIESLTPPPEGDMTIPECRAAWGDKRLWVNLSANFYALPADELSEVVTGIAKGAAVDGKLLAFAISEELPADWKKSIPVILETINGLN